MREDGGMRGSRDEMRVVAVRWTGCGRDLVVDTGYTVQ